MWVMMRHLLSLLGRHMRGRRPRYGGESRHLHAGSGRDQQYELKRNFDGGNDASCA